MNPVRRIRRIAAALAGLACAWLGLAIAAPAAFAQALGSPGYGAMPRLHRQALLRGEDLAPVSGSGSVRSAIDPAVTGIVVVRGMPRLADCPDRHRCRASGGRSRGPGGPDMGGPAQAGQLNPPGRQQRVRPAG